jgi:polysaccharide biosynthesis transport protein
MSDTASQSSTSRPGIGDILAAIYRARLPIACIMAVALAVGIIAALMSEPRYRAAATVQIDQQAAKVLGTEDADPTAAIQDADRFLQTQVDIVRGRDMALVVSQKLKLESDPQAAKALGLDPDSLAENKARRRDDLLRAIERSLEVDLPVDSRLIRISVESRDAGFSAKLANGFADAYVAANLARRQGVSDTLRDLLAKQLTDAETRLGETERAVAAYSRRNQIIRPTPVGPGEKGQSVIEGRLSSLNLAYSNATARRIDAEQRWRNVGGAAAANISEAINNPAYQDLINQRATAQAEYRDQTTRRKADHPIVQQAAARLGELDRQLATFGGGVRGSVQVDYRTALAQERSIASEIERLKNASLDEQDRSVQLGILEREADKARTLYDSVLQRYNEVTAQSQGMLSNTTILGRAAPTFRAVGAPTLLFMALALIAGALLSAFYVAIREMGVRTIHAPHDVAGLSLPVLATLPDIRQPRSIKDELFDGGSRFADSALSAAVALGLVADRDAAVTLAVTSNDAGEGKSTTAFALATALAQAGVKTLLVDLDLRDPSLATITGTGPRKATIADFLARGVSFDEVIGRDVIPGLDCIMAVHSGANMAQLLGGGQVEKLLSIVRPAYSAIILDCPPLLDLADAILIARSTEKTVLVASAGITRFDRISAGLQRLRQAGVQPAGLILNRFDASRQGYNRRYGQPDYGVINAATRFAGAKN